MNESFEDDLKHALRPVDPGDDFTARVMARVGSNVSTLQPRRRPALIHVLPWAPAALAASLLLAIFMTHDQHPVEDPQAGLRAREQLLEALRVTSEKLDIAYQVVHNEANADTDTGA